MSDASPDPSTRVSRWTFAALVVLSTAALWCLDTHQPPQWPDAVTPWFAQVRALAPAAWLVDRLNVVAVTPDLPLVSGALVIGLGVLVLAATRATGSPPMLALATALGVMATRSAWSTVTPGADALPIVAVAAVVLAVAGARHVLTWSALVALAFVAPWLVWLALPIAVLHARSRRTRLVLPAVLVGVALTFLGWVTWRALLALTCADAAMWRHVARQVAMPGASAEVSSWFAMRQAMAIVAGDVHLFGVALATFGIAVAHPAQRRLRMMTLSWVAATVVGVATGLVPPALAAAALLPWWAPWSAAGALALVARVPVHQRRLATGFVVVAAAALPLLRHATVVPGPWVAGEPAIARAVAPAWRGTWMASEQSTATRRWRTAGMATVPADPSTLTACLARGGRVAALGPVVRTIEEQGFTLHENPARVPLAAVIADVRRDQLVALGLSGPALPYLGSAGMAALHRLGIDRASLHATTSVAALARTDVAGRVEAARDGTVIELETGELVAGRQLVDPLTVHAQADRSGIDSPPRQMATSAGAAVAVFDRAQEVLLRSAGEMAPGLLLSLDTLDGWQHATVSGPRSCVSGPSPWLEFRGASRIGAPLVAASPRQPLVAYVASALRPRPDVIGLPLHPVWPEWAIEVFDPAQTTDVATAAARARDDGLDAVSRRPTLWWTRIEVRPRDAWHATTATLVAGIPGDWWVRPAGAPRASTRAVCRQAASGERLLLGQYGAVDDDSPREVGVWAAMGWHAPERFRSTVQQWSAQATATAGFRLSDPVDLTLAMDAQPGRGPLRVAVNGTVVDADWQGARRIAIPAAHLRTGENVLTLSVPDVIRPERDPRSLGVLVRQLRLLRTR